MDCQCRAGSSHAETPAHHRSPSEKLYTIGVALVLVAIVAAGFGVSYLAYAHLAANGPTASVESLGEIWDGATP